MVLAVASIASLVMSAALFGRRSKQVIDDPPMPPDPEGGAAPSGPNVFSPDAATAPADKTSAPEADSQPPAGSDGITGDPEDDGLIGGSLLAELEARAHSNDPAPHPLRPQEMWHPGVIPQPVDLPPPPTEERIDQAELDGIDSVPGRFRFSRLRRVSPGEPPVEPDASGTDTPDPGTTEEPVGDVLFGELFTSDRIPSGTEGLGSGAAPLVPRSDGASSALINGPVRRNPRGSGRALTPLSDPHPQIAGVADSIVADPAAADGADEVPVSAAAAPLDDPSPDRVDDRETVAVEDHDADPVVEPTVVAEQEPEPRLLAADAAGSVDMGDTSLRLDPDAAATVTDDGSVCSVALAGGWCWAALGDEARHLTIATDGTLLQCPPATTVLVTVDDSGRFVVAVRGEAVLFVGGRRIRLRAGAMAFLPHGSDEAQVDVATEAEITADPLVARNLELDAQR